jgi:thiamine biosynthesis lipoprotein
MSGHTARVPAIAIAAALAMLKFEFTQVHMGVSVRLTLFAQNRSQAYDAAQAAFLRFAELDAMMSDYQRASELNRLCAAPAGEWTPVSPDLHFVLWQAKLIAVLTEGAFDATIGPIVNLWRAGRKEGRMPEAEALRLAMSKVGSEKLEVDSDSSQARLMMEGMQLDLGGIAKGYACDEAVDTLTQRGIASAMVEAGGDISVSHPPPGKEAWRISVLEWPGVVVELSNEAMSTSGDSEQFVEIDGMRYSHVADPRTGIGVTSQRPATVVAKSGWLTDSLATAFCVMEPPASMALASKINAKVWIK